MNKEYTDDNDAITDDAQPESDECAVAEEAHAGETSSALIRACEQLLEQHSPSAGATNRVAQLYLSDPRVRSICRRRAIKNGVSLDETNDILQRVAMIFFDRMIDRMRLDKDGKGASAVYAITREIANNVTMEVRRETYPHTFNHQSFEELYERDGTEIADLGGLLATNPDDLIDEIDRRASQSNMSADLERMNSGELKVFKAGVFSFDPETLASIVAAGQEKREAESKKEKPARAKRTPVKRTPEQQELVDIMHSLGKQQQDFAVMLNIDLPRLSSYIYGRTQSVPKDIMEAARTLAVEFDKTIQMTRDKYDRPMGDILAEWKQRLRTECDNEIADFLGVAPMTVTRWRKNEHGTKPNKTQLTRYENIVRKLEKVFLNAQAKAAASTKNAPSPVKHTVLAGAATAPAQPAA